MTDKDNSQALMDASNKLAEEAFKDGIGAEKAKDERASAEKKLTTKQEGANA